MAVISETKQGMLQSIKKDIEKGYTYFIENFKRYHQFMTFIYKTALSPADRSVLQELQKPNMEFNVIEAYISRLVGEFSKMDPGFSVRAKDGVKLVNAEIIAVVEAHLKACFTGPDKDSLSTNIYTRMLSGGWDVGKIYTDYADEKAFEQKIFVSQVFDPTLCVFDPLARESHKGDGRFCAEMFPKSKDEAKALYGSDIIKNLSFTRSADLANFNWSYVNQAEEVVLFAEYYLKKSKRTKIVKLANGHVVPEKSYEKFVERWNEAGIIEQPPAIIKSRMTDFVTIHKVTLTGSMIVSYEETNFKYLPLVFFDGNSKIIRDNDQSSAEQMTRPYVYNARDAQKMKNFAGQSLCNEIENSIQTKWTAPIEAIPDNADYQIAYTQPQKATIMLYNMFKDNDPNQPVTPPREIVRTPIPPEITNTFVMADQVIQAVLGSYDAAIGVNDNDISGVAIMQGAMHSNAAAMPYTLGFINGWNRLAEIYVDLLPKYYVTPRTIPVIKPNGKHDYYEINQGQNVHFDYDASALEVSVQAGVNFSVQKQLALKTIIGLMQASEQFAQFMNTEGLEILLDNLDIRGIDNLKIMAGEWTVKQKQMQEQAMQKAQSELQPAQIAQAQIQIEQQKLAQKQQEAELRAKVDLTKISADDAVKSKEQDIKFLEVMSRIQNADTENALKQEQVSAEQTRSAVDMAISVASHQNETRKMEREHGRANHEEAQEDTEV